MIRLVVVLLVAAVTFTATGQEDAGELEELDGKRRQGLYKSNPNELYVRHLPGSVCEYDQKEVEPLIDGILTRSRIKRMSLGEWARSRTSFDASLFLSVAVGCNDRFFSIDVRFGRTVYHPDLSSSEWWPLRFKMYHETPYGSYGIHNGNVEYLQDAIKEGVESALTDYLKVNFDL
ncbi:MAG: hypothetical protein OXG98_12350 [Gemmatimonadetes bacterium]|nr:hypothetical protein [Gemmatimonadota bacterium]